MKEKIIFCCLSCIAALMLCLKGQAQNEDKRGRDWITLYQLKALNGLHHGAFLTAAQKKQFDSLIVIHSPLAACMKASDKPCGPDNPSVTGLKLTGVRVSSDLVKLEWQTLTETNTDRFVLERRSLTDTLRYDSVFYAKGQGTSYGKTKYGAVDPNSNAVITYYRVKEVDLGGNIVYSNIVDIQGVIPRLALLVAPNPAHSNRAGFFIIGNPASPVAFTVVNDRGMLIIKKENVQVSGSVYISLSAYHLPPGFYTVTVLSDGGRTSRKMIIY